MTNPEAAVILRKMLAARDPVDPEWQALEVAWMWLRGEFTRKQDEEYERLVALEE